MVNKKICFSILFFSWALPLSALANDFWVDNQTPQPFSFSRDGQCANTRFKPFAAHSISKIDVNDMCGDNPRNEEKQCILSFYPTANCHGLYSAFAAFNTKKGIASISRLNYYAIDTNGDAFHIRIKPRNFLG